MDDNKKEPIGSFFAIIKTPEDQKDVWIELGPVWQNQDGSMSMVMHSEPLAWRDPRAPRRIQVRFRKPAGSSSSSSSNGNGGKRRR